MTLADTHGLRSSAIVWCHIPDSAAYKIWSKQIQQATQMKEFCRRGGKILFTDYAALLPFELKLETAKPEVQTLDVKNDGLFDQRGLQSFRGHPVFSGLFGGTFIWDPDFDQQLKLIGYFGEGYPREGRVVAVGRSYVFLHSEQKLMFEYQVGKGKILSVGSMVYFGKQNNRKANLERFVENCFRYLAGEFSGDKTTYWQKTTNVARQFSVSSMPLRSSLQQLNELPSTELVLTRNNPNNEFFNVAGRRCLIMGRENGGIDEVWVHPFRVLRDYRAGLVVGDSVVWLNSLPVRVEARPESFTRIYQTPFGQMKEILFSALESAGGVIHYTLRGKSKVRLVLKYRCDLRLMWPYDEPALGDIYYGYDEQLSAVHVKDRQGEFYCLIGGDRKPLKHLSGQFTEITWEGSRFAGAPTNLTQVYSGFEYELEPADKGSLTFAIVGTDEGKAKAFQDYRSLLSKPRMKYEELVRHYNHLLSSKLTIKSPDVEFNSLFKWALVGTDRFITTTPNVGTALVAGFSTTARGWDGGHKNSGRPGYAWYFGRDSEWSCFAVDDYDDFRTVQQQLEFLQKYQDLSGKILHEVSTSGMVHFDASDATPLYVILATHYLRASGDIAFVRKCWPHLKKAMEFLYSTDSDGDGLIENTNVGHGWVEGGKLWPVHTELYLAGLWAQALKDASYISRHLNKMDLSVKYERDAKRVQTILNRDFWNDSTQFFSYGKRVDGSYNSERTVLPAVVLYYGLADKDKAESVLERYAGNGFTSDWGVRILSSESPLFNPQGYHYGSVWPLFTGWTALAEYQNGSSTQAFTHVSNNLYTKNHWAHGFVEEVMNGSVYKPSGVCPHQCWSETNILHPAITGMIGWKPDAPEKSATISPRFPLHWDSVAVHNLRVGKTVLHLTMKREKRMTTYRFVCVEGSPLSISLSPEIPDGMVIRQAKVNGQEMTVSSDRVLGLLARPITFTLRKHAQVELIHNKGIGMIPLMPKPQPGDSSLGFRVIKTALHGDHYAIDVEGKGGSIGLFEMMIFDQELKSIEGGAVREISGNGRVTFTVRFDDSTTPFVKRRVMVSLGK
jgi:glycogen debranching enzyme